MEIKCQKCGTTAADDQAFCSKCGAVLGMGDAGGRDDATPNLAATVVGKFPFPPPPSRPAASQPPQQQGATPGTPAAAPARVPQTPTPAPPPRPSPVAPQTPPHTAAPQSRASSTTLLVIIGFVAVLLVGGLLIFLFLFNLQS